MRIVTFLLIFLAVTAWNMAPAQNRTASAQPDPDREKLLTLAREFNARYQLKRAELERIANEKGWVLRQETPEGVSEIQMVDDRGFPQAYITHNLNAGRTTNTDDIWSGGSTGLNLTGNGYLVGEWDGGGVLTTHQEFNNGAGSRVTQMDAPGSTHYHSTHVAGTIIAEGQVAAAHGMATQALLNAYEWTNDVTEMTTAAANGLTLSNHSYGWNRGWVSSGGNMYWYGNPSISTTEDYLFGFYDASSQDWDNIAFNAPNYLIVKSSGNDRNDSYTGSHYVYNGTSWVVSNAVRDPDGGSDGYDCIEQQGVAKNILTVGAVNDIAAGWTSPASVVQSSFSSWGPTDDGRIKPDLVANGVGVYSATNTGNADYTTLDGTSMSAPNTTGTLVLLQDYYKSLRGATMSAAALKGLAINTANEAGPGNGPDYQNGWGLLNASGAANLITADNTQGGLIVQAILMNGQTTDYTYYSDGTSNINVTLCWTDPAGTPPAAALNPSTLMLVNDLDVRVIGSSTNFPWILNPASPAAAATKGDNFRDNVETVNVLSPAAGYYTIRVNHGGALSGGSQAYALIISGLRTPPVAPYCTARSTNWANFEYISKVVMGSISNTTGRSPGGYHDYTGLVNQLIKGTTETLMVTINGYSSDYGMAWIDWNQDGDFGDAGESIVLGSGAGPTYSVNITAPMTALSGYTTLRVRLGYSSAPLACGSNTYGETEDYTVQVLSGCEASGGCDEYIYRVQAGTINNQTGCSGYADYTATQSTNLPVNGIAHVTVTNGKTIYPSDQCGIWVDWNRNGSFYDAGEQVTVTGTPGVGPYTASVIPPAGQTTGPCTMRVRIMYTGTMDPCGATNFGEVEDYTLNVTAQVPNQWVGNVSHAWEDPMNWLLEHVPTATEDVTINTGYTYYPILAATNGECDDLTLGAGAKLSVDMYDLTVNNNMILYGLVEQTHANADFFVQGNVYWESGSTAAITGGEFWVTGDWEFRNGSNVHLDQGFVYFEGTATSFIRVYPSNSYFNHLVDNKSSASLYFSAASSDSLKINGNLYTLQSTSTFYSNTSQPTLLKGQLSNAGHVVCPLGTFFFDGTTHSVNLNTGDYFNNLVIRSSGAVTLADSLRVHGNLTIESGSLAAGAFPIIIEGNWTNQVGTAGFDEGTGKVVFDGASHQYVLSNETFNIIEASMGAALRVNNVANTVICNQYLWTSGGIDVLAGTFTALDLAQNGLYGGFWLNPGGTINLYNNDEWVDLNGELHIYGGNFNVYGGNGSDSFWPYNANGSIEMSAGTLDFKNAGIYVYPSGSYTFAENITGGTIRTARGFRSYRNDFQPAGSTLEFYGPTDGNFYTAAGSFVNHVVVNKTAADQSVSGSASLVRDRESSTVTEAPLATSIAMNGNVDINGNVTIQAGTLSANSYTMTVEGNWNNLVGSAGFTEGTGTVEFDGAAAADIITPETFYNLNLNKSYPNFDGLEVLQDVAITNDLHLIDGTLELNDPADLYIGGNLTIDLNSGLNANDSYSTPPYGPEIRIVGNWTNANTTHNTLVGFDPGVSSVFFIGSADQFLTTGALNEQFYYLVINKPAGKFRPNDNLTCTDNILIASGSWEDNIAGLTHQVYGNFTVNATGAFLTSAFPNTLEFIGSEHSALTYNSGTGYFRNITVNKGVGYSVTQQGNISLQFGGNLTITQGYYFLNGHQAAVFGDVTVGNAGYLNLSPSSILVLSDSRYLNVNSGGSLVCEGSSSSYATIRANVTTVRYWLNINSGGTVAADYTNFVHVGIDGVNVAPGATVDPLHAFRYCRFMDGASGGVLLTINNSQTLTIRNAIFPSNTWGGANNVRKSVNSGHLYFVDFTGSFSGESFDFDPFNLVDWVSTLTATATATPGSVCAGTPSQLNVTRTGGLSPFTYLWSPSANLSNATLQNPVATPPSSTTYSVTVTDALGTTATHSVALTVTPVLPAGVSIAASANPSPPGNFVTFTATPVNGGSLPGYQWKVNGVNVGSGLSTYSYVPSNNDQVTCVMTSNYACSSGNPATSNVVTMLVVNTNATVTGNVPSPLNLCFDATNTLTVAGGGNSFTVQPGASVSLVAGQKISLLYGTRIFPGGYLHGYITLTNGYCGSMPPAIPATVTVEEPEVTMPDADARFKVYPNPTSGRFFLAQTAGEIAGSVRVEILNMRGVRLMAEEMTGSPHEFDLGNLPAGLYLVRVIRDSRVETFKVILDK